MAKRIVSVYAAVNSQMKLVRGKDGLPGETTEERGYFLKMIRKHWVVMGRKSHERLCENAEPLPCKGVVVLTKKKNYPTNDCKVAQTLAVAGLVVPREVKSIVIIGGQATIEKALILSDLVDRVYLSLSYASPEEAAGSGVFPVNYLEGFRVRKTIRRRLQGAILVFERKKK